MKQLNALKKIGLLLSPLMILAFTSFSQTSKFSLVINAPTTNFNYGKSNGPLSSFKKDFRGLEIGASYQVGITPVFSVVPEFYFAMKGGVLEQKNPITENKSTVRLYSIEIPVLARWHIRRFYLNAGPYVAYNLGGRIKTDGSETLPEKTTAISFGNSPDDFKRLDFGFEAGMGYNFKMKQSVVTLDVRYGYGLVNISESVERYNRSFNVSLLVSKPKKKNKKR